MKPSDVIDLQLDALFGGTLARKIQALVDAELNEGKWVEGYDIAVKSSELDGIEAQELLQVVLSQFPDLVINKDELLESVEKNLPQSMGAKVLWMVAEDKSFVLTDSLRVARYRNSNLIWVTPRISFNGIEFDNIDDEVVKGRAWWLGGFKPDAPFIIDLESGTLIEGQVVPE